MDLKVYNTLSKGKEPLIPKEPGHFKIYVCGPTTYNFIHLGNARPLVVFDTIRRYLEYRGYKVLYIQNFTDIDDKIINRAQEEKMEPLELAEKYIEEYFRDADALRVRRADVHPRASEHIPEMLEMVKVLYDKGIAYEESGDLYFSVRKFEDYGKLSGRSLEEMQSGARIDVDERKGDPLDFALWKGAKPGEPSWKSPWGEGRPGWHIECSAMSIKYLGNGFDIHGGGNDLIFPHHENEIAQAEAYAGSEPFARYWMHNGFVTVDQEKMSKSLGNFFIVRDLLHEWPPEILRFFLLSTHYRRPLDYNTGSLKAARKSYNRLANTLELLDNLLHEEPTTAGGGSSEKAEELEQVVEAYLAKFVEAMDDDFNTALGLAVLFDIGREINTFINNQDFELTADVKSVLARVHGVYQELLDTLGLLPGEKRELGEEYLEGIRGVVLSVKEELEGLLPTTLPEDSREMLDLLLGVRQQVREQKDFRLSDRLRDALKEEGIILEDTARGTRWRIV